MPQYSRSDAHKNLLAASSFFGAPMPIGSLSSPCHTESFYLFMSSSMPRMNTVGRKGK